jgi:signal transduction histidine kinase
MTDLIKTVQKRWIALPIRVRGTAIVAIPVTFLFTTLSAFAWLKSNLVEDEAWVQHTQTVRLETKQLLNALIDAETGVRGYGLTQRDEFLEPYDRAIAVIPDSLDQLENLVQDNPHQTHEMQDIRAIVNENLEIFKQKLALQKDLKRIRGTADVLVPAASLYDWLDEGKATMDAARREIDRFAETEEELLIKRIRHRDFYRQLTWIFMCISVAIGTIAAAFAVHLFYQLERELAEREENLRQSNQRLENVCDQLQRFTANASHELRAPLAAVLSNAQVVLMDFDDLEEIPVSVENRLQKIVGITKHMSSLVGELLFLARHEGLLADESMQTVDLTQLLSNLFSEWLPQAKNQSLQLTKELPDRPILVRADANLLRQAIANFLSNACRYTPAGGSIELGLKTEEERALIWVSDTGIGISEEALPHVFERFYRADLKRSKASGGFGLGLAIADQIVRAHGGEIGADSSLGKGSTFTLKLPILN